MALFILVAHVQAARIAPRALNLLGYWLRQIDTVREVLDRLVDCSWQLVDNSTTQQSTVDFSTRRDTVV